MDENAEVLSSEDYDSALSLIIKDGIATQIRLTLTGGVFFVAFALLLGASNIIIGILMAIPGIFQLLRLPAIYIVETYKRRRIITVIASFFMRIGTLIMAFIPILFDYSNALIVLVLVIILRSSSLAVAGCSWNSWMRNTIKSHHMGKFFSKRMQYGQIVDIPIAFLAGLFVDQWTLNFPIYEIFAYTILFVGAFASGMISIYLLWKTPEPKMCIDERSNLRDTIRAPLKDKNYIKVLIFVSIWVFGLNLIVPFISVYMLETINLSVFIISILYAISQITSILSLRKWGKLSDKYSNKAVFKISGTLYIICFILWTFTTMPEVHILTYHLLVIIHIFTGVASAGTSLTIGNIMYKLSPTGQSTSYLALGAIFTSVPVAIAPLIGGFLIDFFIQTEFIISFSILSPIGDIIVNTIVLRGWDFFFIFAVIICIFAIRKLGNIDELNEVKGRILFNRIVGGFKREMRHLVIHDNGDE